MKLLSPLSPQLTDAIPSKNTFNRGQTPKISRIDIFCWISTLPREPSSSTHLHCFIENSEDSVSLTRICGASRALQATALDLERQRATDSLKKGLEKRPEREELVESMFCLRNQVLLRILILTDQPIFREHSSRLESGTCIARTAEGIEKTHACGQPRA